MRRPNCSFSSTLALRRVFIPELGNNALLSATQQHMAYSSAAAARRSAATAAVMRTSVTKPIVSSSPAVSQPYRTRPAQPIVYQRRQPFSTTPRSLGRPKPGANKPGNANRKQRPMNRNIPYFWVHIQLGNGQGLSEPLRKQDVLNGLDPSTHDLVMLTGPPKTKDERDEGQEEEEEEPDRDTDPEGYADEMLARENDPSKAAVCKIVSKAEVAAREAQLAKAAREKNVNTKELELGWAIDTHDMGHKFKRLQGFLEKGMRVNVLLARKRGAKLVTNVQAENVVKEVYEAIKKVAGAREVKKMEGEPGKVVRLAFEGPASARRAAPGSGKKKDKKNKNKNGDDEEGANA